MEDDIFYKALYHIMWEMEVDIFSEKERTLAMLADLVPKCKKQRRRFKAMYDYNAMEYIEKAVADPENSDTYLKMALVMLVTEADMSDEKALTAVNTVARLWDTFPPLGDDFESIDVEKSKVKKPQKPSGGDEVILLNDVPIEQKQESEKVLPEEPEQKPELEQTPEPEPELEPEENDEPKENLLKKLATSWCRGDSEDGRPLMIADPLGWLMIIFSCVLGIFMVMDISRGDKLAVPAFAFTFMVLTSKRLYRFGSSARYSVLLILFYAAAAFRNLWIGEAEISYLVIPFMIVVFTVFNNGRISSWLDESKKKSVAAYLIITVFSAAIAVGAYAIQTVVTL